ncbi:MAG: protein kinase [Gammaproteobacteria bacterium]|nr:protein kinase [Gammaproteobacteria bacterium]
MYRFPESSLKALRENRIETLDMGTIGFKGLATLSGHMDRVRSLIKLSDGRLASGSEDDTIRLWNVSSGECEATLLGHEYGVFSLTELSDGRLASGSGDRTIRLWNVSSGKCEATLWGHKDGVRSLTVLSDGRLASGSWDNTIRLWNVSSGACEATLSGHYGVVNSLTELSDGRLASGSYDKTIRLWNVSSGECEVTLSGHYSAVMSLTVLSDGRLASGSGDRTIRLWNVSSGKCEATLSGHKYDVTSLTVLSDGRLASGSRDCTIRLWNVSSGECEATLWGHEEDVVSLTVLSDGRLVSGATDAKINLWPIAPNRILFLSLSEALRGNNTLKKIVWSGTESLFNHEQHVWLNTLLVRNQASKIAVSPSALLPKEPERAAGGAGAESSSASDEIAKLRAQLAAKEAELAAKPVVVSSFRIIPHKDLNFGRELGDGGFGIVYEAKWGSINVAVKVLKMKDLPEKLAAEFKGEALLHAGLHHDNVVKLKGVCLEPKKYALVMELLPNGSLFSVLHNGKDLPYSVRLTIARDIANGLDYLHQQGILHRDLKSLNVLLDDRMRAKLADFGLSDIKTGTIATRTTGTITGPSIAGSVLWMAPELFKRGGKCTESSDIYAMGMVFWELASRDLPFKDARGSEALVVKWVSDGDREAIPTETPGKLASLIGRCWAQKIEDRPKSAKVVLDELMK